MRHQLSSPHMPRKMLFSMCEWGWQDPWKWAPPMANMWRITNDIWPEWARVMSILDTNSALSAYAGPGHWNDPDMIEVCHFITQN